MDQNAILSGLESSGLVGFPVEVHDEVTSTNSVAIDSINRGHAPADGFAVTAELQTAGRGRLDRQWESPSGAGIALTIALPELKFPEDKFSLIPLAVGLAARSVLIAAGCDVSLKWPNDLVIVGSDGLRKLGGILVQRHPGWIIAGIGINISLTREQLPIPTATSLNIEGIDASRNELIPSVIAGYVSRIESIGSAEFLTEYVDACCTFGAQVRVEGVAGSIVSGTASGINADGALLVTIDDGSTVAIQSGDVMHVR